MSKITLEEARRIRAGRTPIGSHARRGHGDRSRRLRRPLVAFERSDDVPWIVSEIAWRKARRRRRSASRVVTATGVGAAAILRPERHRARRLRGRQGCGAAVARRRSSVPSARAVASPSRISSRRRPARTISTAWARSSPEAAIGVASGHPLAAAAGLRALDDGGSCVDAALAMAFSQWVVGSPMCGPGGEMFVLHVNDDGATVFGGWSRTPAEFPRRARSCRAALAPPGARGAPWRRGGLEGLRAARLVAPVSRRARPGARARGDRVDGAELPIGGRSGQSDALHRDR